MSHRPQPSAPPSAPPALEEYHSLPSSSHPSVNTWKPLESYGEAQPPWARPPPYLYGEHSSSPSGFPPPPPPPLPPQALFPPGTDPEIVKSFLLADANRNGSIDDLELQRSLSSSNHQFSLRTVHLLMFLFANNTRRIGPVEFASLWRCLKEWRIIFERFDRDRSGRIDSQELRDALWSLGYVVSPSILNILLSTYDRTGHAGAIDYDGFIECGIIVKGLTDMFKAKDIYYTGSATLTYETFMLMVLPYIIT